MSITVSVILDKKRESKKGYPVKLRITENKIQKFIALKVYLSDDEFDKIRAGKQLNEVQKQIEQRIKAIELKANSIINKLDKYSFIEFRAIYENKLVNSEKSFEKLIQVRIEEFKNQNKISSAS